MLLLLWYKRTMRVINRKQEMLGKFYYKQKRLPKQIMYRCAYNNSENFISRCLYNGVRQAPKSANCTVYKEKQIICS
ncbi:unnamed protein product [Paramecium pentaurelia]|uniref:Uncharacterized protein n=1 Tax=Paramecium pentaurelia TaxID=43138 RepID=A0A8S1TRQ6_9CILI|nr:unnamed protein product [Paramecium pentaurelia]